MTTSHDYDACPQCELEHDHMACAGCIRLRMAVVAYAGAVLRLNEERESGCACPQDIAFWESEVQRLEDMLL